MQVSLLPANFFRKCLLKSRAGEMRQQDPSGKVATPCSWVPRRATRCSFFLGGRRSQQKAMLKSRACEPVNRNGPEKVQLGAAGRSCTQLCAAAVREGRNSSEKRC